MKQFEYVLQCGVRVSHARVASLHYMQGPTNLTQIFAFEIFTVYYNQVLFCCDVFLSTQSTYRYCP